MAGLKSWSTTAANNVLANTGFTMDEGQAPSSVNDSVRQLMADVKTEWSKASDVASATTPDITGTATTSGGYIHITGTTTITGFATATAGIRRRLVFDGALTLTYNATSLILPGAANITTAANDCAEFVSEGSGNWRCVNYQLAGSIGIRVKVGTFTRDASLTSALSITGVGFKPKLVRFTVDLTGMAVGSDDGTTAGLVAFLTAPASVPNTAWSLGMYVDASNVQFAKVSSMDTDGFTLTFTAGTTGSPTGTATIVYEAIG